MSRKAMSSRPCATQLGAEQLESKRLLTTLLFDDFHGEALTGVVNDVVFTPDTAVFRTHDDSIDYEASLFPSQGTMEVRLRIDEAAAFDRHPGGWGFNRFSTILDSGGADGRNHGDFWLAVNGNDGRVGFTFDPAVKVNHARSTSSILDGACHSIAISYGSEGVKLFIDGSLEDSNTSVTTFRKVTKGVSLGDYKERQFTDKAFAFGFIGEVDAIRTSDIQSDVTLSGECAPLPGDANRDGSFDELDIVQILQSGKYLTGDHAVWEEGDWNGDDRFDQQDIVAALLADNYRSPDNLVNTFSCEGWLTSIHVKVDFVPANNAADCRLNLELSDNGVKTPSGFIDRRESVFATITRQNDEELNSAVEVFLTNSNPKVVEVPRSITVPAGERTQSFEIVIKRDNVDGDSENVTIRTVHPSRSVPLRGGESGGGIIIRRRVIWVWR